MNKLANAIATLLLALLIWVAAFMWLFVLPTVGLLYMMGYLT